MLSFNYCSGDGQHIPFLSQPPFLGYSRTKLWLSSVCVLLAGKRRGFNHLLWPMDVLRIFLVCSLMLHNQGFMCPLAHMNCMWTPLTHMNHNNLPFYLCLLQFLCSCPAVSLGSDNQSYAFCAVRAGSQRVAIMARDKKMQSSAWLTWPFYPGIWQLPCFLLSQCSAFSVFYTVYIATDSNSRLPCLMFSVVSHYQIFYTVFIHPVNRKMAHNLSCYLQTMRNLPCGKEEYSYSCNRQSASKKQFPSPEGLCGSKSLLCNG